MYYMRTCKNCFKKFEDNKKDHPKQYCVPCRKEKDNERFLRSILKRKYGITIEQRESKRLEQENKCAICKQDNSIDRDFSVDHDHVTKKFRGLLCHNCNTGLGKFKDSPELLRLAAAYIEKS